MNIKRSIVAYLDGLQVQVNALREGPPPSLRDSSPRGGRKGGGLLMPSILDKAFKGEL